MPINIRDFIPCESMFERMSNYNENYENISYNEFYQWNIRYINELSAEDYSWIVGLCERIIRNKINLVDEESCVEFSACGIYFDFKGNLCILNHK